MAGENDNRAFAPRSENSSNRVDSQPVAERKLIKTEALIVAYAMARLGPPFLAQMGWQSWTDAFAKVGERLGEKHNSIKLLRDEFDVFFPNGRRGWLLREPHPSRLAILHEFSTVSDAALVEFVKHILAGDQASVEEVVDLVSEPPNRVSNVAERLLTGKLAEEHFLRASEKIIGAPLQAIVDMRHRACGYDFECPSSLCTPFLSRPQPRDLAENGGPIAIEIKGMKASRGGILFTDREWSEAQNRGHDYWLVIIGQLDQEKFSEPKARIVPSPTSVFGSTARCQVVQSTSAVWGMTVSV